MSVFASALRSHHLLSSTNTSHIWWWLRNGSSAKSRYMSWLTGLHLPSPLGHQPSHNPAMRVAPSIEAQREASRASVLTLGCICPWSTWVFPQAETIPALCKGGFTSPSLDLEIQTIRCWRVSRPVLQCPKAVYTSPGRGRKETSENSWSTSRGT